MRRTVLYIFVLAAGSLAYAKNPKPYQTGQLLQVTSIPCSSDRAGALCPEYTLKSENLVYHIRPRHQKQAVTLFVGDRAQFRIDSNFIFLRTEEANRKDQQFRIISAAPVPESNTADSHPIRLNHLQ